MLSRKCTYTCRCILVTGYNLTLCHHQWHNPWHGIIRELSHKMVPIQPLNQTLINQQHTNNCLLPYPHDTSFIINPFTDAEIACVNAVTNMSHHRDQQSDHFSLFFLSGQVHIRCQWPWSTNCMMEHLRLDG